MAAETDQHILGVKLVHIMNDIAKRYIFIPTAKPHGHAEVLVEKKRKLIYFG